MNIDLLKLEVHSKSEQEARHLPARCTMLVGTFRFIGLWQIVPIAILLSPVLVPLLVLTGLAWLMGIGDIEYEVSNKSAEPPPPSR